MADMTTALGATRLPNPVMTASGCAANGKELHRFFPVSDLGAFTTKTVMRDPRSGRPTPRMAETDSGMLNSIGLQGPGIETFCVDDLPWLATQGARVLVSVAGGTAEEFGEVVDRLVTSPGWPAVVGVEANISCPNVANRGLVFACDPVSSERVVRIVRGRVPAGTPVFAKLTPDVTDVVAIASAALGAGATGLTMINTLLGVVVDTDRLRPRLAGVTGGLSGPAILPVAVRAVWQVTAAMRAGLLPRAPVIGVGGVRTGADALQLVAAGASAVQVGTATFNDPSAPRRVLAELEAEIDRHGFDRFADVVGIAHERTAAP
ncbi:dihydroorotate dehydrogenase [Phycicoccus flavus]|uniref:dihydroorotate dehydrogenase n=1 Tax=Phycicoccus flavus TaxID=2502783 RepID=UPI000FEBB9D5|nr:dihydroorotate dehydrogenase [Phycicoccus flavus]NHA69653.1 dihydroorotate dehydrogenase [Phycicoccus flavus]